MNKQTHTIRWRAEALPALIEKKLTYAVDVTLESGSTQISVGEPPAVPPGRRVVRSPDD